jgi:hypothetical protein
MQHPPKLQLSDDSGIRHGRLKDLTYISNEAIDDIVEEGQNAKQPRAGFTEKNYMTVSSESREVASLRQQAGWQTQGKSAAENREDPPTQKREAARLIEPPKKKGECGSWGGGLSEPGGYV